MAIVLLLPTYAIINMTTLSAFRQLMYIAKFVKEIAMCVIIHLNRIDILVSTLLIHFISSLSLFFPSLSPT